MRKAALTLATAATIGVSALVAPSPAQAWRGGGWGWGGGLAAGLIGAAVIGGIASSAYAYGPGYGYYGGYAPAYYGGYAPAYYNYGYAPAYYGGYRSGYYAGPGYRRVIRPRIRVRRPQVLSRRVSLSLVIGSGAPEVRTTKGRGVAMTFFVPAGA
ncbi:hypothetical protein SAMN05444321_0230 [Bradyrhizobium lablabi]|nr:hypothetical protein SAMN05444321_0230 [Bradyrhizobium lablabi]